MIKCTIFRTLVQKGNKWKTKKLYSNFSTNNCILQTRHYADQNFSMSKKKKKENQTYVVLYTNRTGIRCC